MRARAAGFFFCAVKARQRARPILSDVSTAVGDVIGQKPCTRSGRKWMNLLQSFSPNLRGFLLEKNMCLLSPPWFWKRFCPPKHCKKHICWIILVVLVKDTNFKAYQSSTIITVHEKLFNILFHRLPKFCRFWFKVLGHWKVGRKTLSIFS